MVQLKINNNNNNDNKDKKFYKDKIEFKWEKSVMSNTYK